MAQVDVIGTVSASGDLGRVSGIALGGRRVRVALVALALAQQPIAADRLASILWSDDPPPTWQAALRGVIRALRGSVAPIGLGGQRLVVTVPSGYGLAADVKVDIWLARDAVRGAAALLAEGRFEAAIAAAEAASMLDSSALLPGEDLPWLGPHRLAVDQARVRALGIIAEAAGALGGHDRAVDAARDAVAAAPLDEAAHRGLIRALERAGNQAGVVRAYEQCRSLLADQLGVDPSTQTVQAYLVALHSQAAGAAARLPAAPSSFVGRQAEAAWLGGPLGAPGLVTITGRGGVGKSRLALQVASSMPRFEGGRLWVPMAAVADDALAASSVAIEIGAKVGLLEPADAITAHLAPLGRVLLILDGCEAVVDGVASLLSALLATCKTLTVLATSRLPLGVEGEQVMTVEPFPQPSGASPAALARAAQVQLLVDRIRDSGGDLALDDVTAPLVAALCQRCGGLPLAVELVAARLDGMSLGDLLDDLGDGYTDEQDRLRSVLRASYALLGPDEAAVFRRLAVLSGPAGLPLIRPVVAAAGVAPVRVARILAELAARSLLAVDRSGPRWRYQQDDDLRRFAAELLAGAGEERDAYARLADALGALLPADAGVAPAQFQDEITDVLGSLRSLLSAALDGPADRARGLELAFRLHRYWAATDVSEGRFWLSRLLADDPQSPWTGYARFALGYLSYWSGDAATAISELESAAAALRERDELFAGRALIYLGGLADDADRGGDAVDFIATAIELAEHLGDPSLHAAAVAGMGSILAERADPAAARYAAQSVELRRRSGSAEQLAAVLPNAAMVCWQVGALDQARAHVAQAWPMHSASRRIARVVLLSVAAGLALADGDLAAAVDFARSADREGTELGVERELPLVRTVLARALLAHGDLPGAAEHAVAAIAAAQSISFVHPLAMGLETAALVGLASGTADRADLASLLRCSADIRARGARPGIPSLAAAVRDASGQLDISSAAVLTAAQSAALATDIGRRCLA